MISLEIPSCSPIWLDIKKCYAQLIHRSLTICILRGSYYIIKSIISIILFDSCRIGAKTRAILVYNCCIHALLLPLNILDKFGCLCCAHILQECMQRWTQYSSICTNGTWTPALDSYIEQYVYEMLIRITATCKRIVVA